jgi:eukaryotic-like serine/threonine-protein kinase
MNPKTLGRYTIEAAIGEGAMGRVYRAFDPLARRVVAIKTIKTEVLTEGTREEYTRRFQREAQAAASLIHPSVTTIFDVGESYFVMEFVEGETLQSVLKRKGRLSARETLEVLAPIADALDYVHGKGVVHRDIKPANIMVLPNGRAKLMDFGVVHVESTAMTAVGETLGSPPYMAPEQITGGEITGQTDIFALGTVTYEMLSGRCPFDADNVTSVIYRVLNEAPPPVRSWSPELPAHFDEAIARALAKDPKARPQTAMELVGALYRGGGLDSDASRGPRDSRPLATSSADTTPTLPTLPAAPAPGARRATPVLLAAAAVVLLAAGWFALRRRTPEAVSSPLAVSTATPTVATPSPSDPPRAVETEPAGVPVSPEVTPSSGSEPAAAAVVDAPEPRAIPVVRKPVAVVARPKRTVTKSPPRPQAPPPPVHEGDLVALGPGVTPPRKISGKTAYYPPAALEKRLQGKVVVELVVSEKGEPSDLRVVESAGSLLDKAVLDAIRTWRYEPAVMNGVKVRVRVQEGQSFELRAPP